MGSPAPVSTNAISVSRTVGRRLGLPSGAASCTSVTDGPFLKASALTRAGRGSGSIDHRLHRRPGIGLEILEGRPITLAHTIDARDSCRRTLPDVIPPGGDPGTLV